MLSPETIRLQLRSNQRDQLFAELIDSIPGINHRPEAKKTLLRAVLEREQLYTTCVGDGLAIPHARNAIPGLTDHPVIVFGRHEKGVLFGPNDKTPVRLLFLLIAPTISEHLQVMARLSRLLRDSLLRVELLQAETPSAVIDRVQHAEERV